MEAVGAGNVFALASSGDGSTIYVGGEFTSVQGTTGELRGRLVVGGPPALEVQRERLGPRVRRLGSTVYMGGAFRKIQTVDRLGLAAINERMVAAGLVALGTIPGTTTVPIVRSMALATGMSPRSASSQARTARGGPQSEPNQARFDATTGAMKPWADNYAFLSYGIVSDGTNYYVAAGGPGGSILRYGPTGGQSRVSTDGDVQAIGLFEGQVIAGGHFLLTSGKDILACRA